MITGLDLNATVDYTLKGDTDNPTVWKIGVIPSYLFARISGDAVNKEIETVYKLLQIALKGWENFNIPYETNKEKFFGRDVDVVPLAVLERIPLQVVTELSMKVMEINQLSEGERKN
jgi:hypothetical protein